MSRKINPDSQRLGINKPWSSKWFYFKRQGKFYLQEDTIIRETINNEMKNVGIDSIDIERTQEDIRVNIKSNKPGLIIGRGGKGIERLKKALDKKMKKLRKEKGISLKYGLHLNVVEMGRYDISGQVIADQIASDLERRIPFRVVMKRQMRQIQQNRNVEGVRMQVSGRLNGSEFARTEWMDDGNMPLQSLRADIDFGESEANTTFGSIGVKVWLYKGEIFEEEDEDKK
ncbi:MAG TPA: 30S ribosomal protein S3 [Candidatus Paceibacterota bacterium]|nr:30S ribosomal protein S3 [Candidatus Paceibacterota bacterium]